MKRNKHYPKSYKEREISTPHESGRKELSTNGDKDSVSDTRAAHNTDNETIEYTPKSAIEWAFWESSSDAEQDIYDAIDYSLWNTQDVSPALMEALEYYEEHEEVSSAEKLHQLAKNHKTKIESTNQYEDYDEDFYEQRKNKKMTKKDLENQELEEKYEEIEEEIMDKTNRISKSQKEMSDISYDGKKDAKIRKNTKSRNAKSKERYNRSHKTDRKNNKNTQKDIEKYGFAA